MYCALENICFGDCRWSSDEWRHFHEGWPCSSSRWCWWCPLSWSSSFATDYSRAFHASTTSREDSSAHDLWVACWCFSCFSCSFLFVLFLILACFDGRARGVCSWVFPFSYCIASHHVHYNLLSFMCIVARMILCSWQYVLWSRMVLEQAKAHFAHMLVF